MPGGRERGAAARRPRSDRRVVSACRRAVSAVRRPVTRAAGDLTLTIPNPHRGDIGRDLLKRVLDQAGISRDEWERL